jgi:hypothetical protein
MHLVPGSLAYVVQKISGPVICRFEDRCAEDNGSDLEL